MKSVLIVSPVPIFPADQGDKLCTLAYAEVLAKHAHVDLLVIGPHSPANSLDGPPFRSSHFLPTEAVYGIVAWRRILCEQRHPLFLFRGVEKLVEDIHALASRLGTTHIHFEFSIHAAAAIRLQNFSRFRTSLRCQNIESRVLAHLGSNSTEAIWKKFIFRLI